ncbi:MAG: HAD family hydrolase [Candidatus Dormibacteraceae bacterium]
MTARAAPAPPAAAVFDCDGLLLDTEPLWTIGEQRLFRRYGRAFTPDAKRALLGTSGEAAGRVLAGLLGQPGRGLALVGELLDECQEAMADATPMPGARELLARIDGRLPIAAASNSPRRLLEPALRGANLGVEFSAVLSVDDVAHPKPSPDLYLDTCERLRVAPARAIALEDSPTGVAAARAAGLWVIGIPSYPGVLLDADLVAPSLAAPEVAAALGI